MATGADFLNEARKFIGDPYVYGGAGPTNFDCSGLVQYALEQLGLKNIPRTSEQQWAWSAKISKQDLQPGDLIFSQWPGDGASPGHVAIYAGGGQLIEAPKPGESVHQVAFDEGYQKYVTGYGRVPGTGGFVQAPSGGGNSGGSQGTSFLDKLGALTPGVSLVSDVANSIYTTMSPVTQVFNDVGNALETAMHAVLWLVNPMNWVRIIAGIVGGASLFVGAILIAKAA